MSFLKGGDDDFNKAMEELDVQYDDMYKPEQKLGFKVEKKDYMDQQNFQWSDGMYNDIMEPSESEKKMKAENLMKIQYKRDIMVQNKQMADHQRYLQLQQQNQGNLQAQQQLNNYHNNINGNQQFQQQQINNNMQSNVVLGQPVDVSGYQNKDNNNNQFNNNNDDIPLMDVNISGTGNQESSNLLISSNNQFIDSQNYNQQQQQQQLQYQAPNYNYPTIQ